MTRSQELTGLLVAPLPGPNANAELSVREALRTRGIVVLQVAGGSMGPWLRPGDLVVIRRCQAEELSAGRVVVFAREGHLVIHRILRRAIQSGECVLLTKGDAAPRPDAPVRSAELLGEVLSIEREHNSLDLSTPGQIFWGHLLSKLSPSSRFWYSGARFGRRLCSRVL